MILEVTQKTQNTAKIDLVDMPPTQFELGLIAKEIGFVVTQLEAFDGIFTAQ